jgi:hypothetical protein
MKTLKKKFKLLLIIKSIILLHLYSCNTFDENKLDKVLYDTIQNEVKLKVSSLNDSVFRFNIASGVKNISYYVTAQMGEDALVSPNLILDSINRKEFVLNSDSLLFITFSDFRGRSWLYLIPFISSKMKIDNDLKVYLGKEFYLQSETSDIFMDSSSVHYFSKDYSLKNSNDSIAMVKHKYVFSRNGFALRD